MTDPSVRTVGGRAGAHDAHRVSAWKALADPLRWHMLQQMAQRPELASSVLEDSVPVTRATISHHIKILRLAGLIEVRRRGRSCAYAVRREVLRQLVDEVRLLAGGADLLDDGAWLEGMRDRALGVYEAGDPTALVTW